MFATSTLFLQENEREMYASHKFILKEFLSQILSNENVVFNERGLTRISTLFYGIPITLQIWGWGNLNAYVLGIYSLDKTVSHWLIYIYKHAENMAKHFKDDSKIVLSLLVLFQGLRFYIKRFTLHAEENAKLCDFCYLRNQCTEVKDPCSNFYPNKKVYIDLLEESFK